MRIRAAIIASLILMSASQAAAQDTEYIFSLADANHDDEVDGAEAAGFADLNWARADRERSGRISVDALRLNPLLAMISGGQGVGQDGMLTRQAFDAAAAARFAAADTSGDAWLDVGEFGSYLGFPPAPAMRAAPPPTLLPSLAHAFAAGLPTCEAIGSDPRYGLAGLAGVSDLTARRMPAAGQDAAYCRVQFVYNSGLSGPEHGYDIGQSQAIGIRIGLPLRMDDGGGSGLAGWNGRIQNLGSGGCMGNMPSVTVATNAGFAGSSSDGGHGAPYIMFNCDFGVIQARHELNRGLIRDFTAEHVRWQTVWTRTIVDAYYGQPAQRTYWSGCSQGGREGHIALQNFPEEYDGILAGGSALYWMRFQMAQAWSGVVIKDMLRSRGMDLTAQQITETVRLEVAACDNLDGVADGVLGDPRQCLWSAAEAVCGRPGASQSECLNAAQAAAFDTIRGGPHNRRGEMIWFPWEPGTTFSTETEYILADSIMQWALRDLDFSSEAHLYMDRAALRRAHDPLGITYEDMATLASQQVSDLADTDNAAIDAAQASGVRFLSWTGTADRNIHSRNSIKYLRDVARHLGQAVDDPNLQSWFRVVLYPSVDHCRGGVGPQPGAINDGPLFLALVDWVENGHTPDRIIATNVDQSGAITRTRPVCTYPLTAIYDGEGSTDDAANFVCGGNLETAEIVARDVLAPHKRENGTGQIPRNYRAVLTAPGPERRRP